MAKVRKTGNWNKARALSKNLKSEIEIANKIALQRIGLETEKWLVKYIKSQPSTWPPLSPEYLKQKTSGNPRYSELMLIRSGTYINSITSTVIDPASKVFVGVKRGAQSEDGEDLIEIGAVMEFGSEKRNIKARPHFSPVNRYMRKRIVEKRLFTKHIGQVLNKKYGV